MSAQARLMRNAGQVAEDISMLFPEPQHARTRHLGRVEPYVHWFTESTRPEASKARAVVNRWYEDFPDHDGRLAARLRSESDADHHQALDELHLHHLLAQQHDDVRYEEGGHGPDFRIYVAGRCAGAIEVLSLFQRQDWTDEQARHGRLADELDSRVRPTAGYFANFQIKAADRDPSPRRFADYIAARIAELPPYDEAPPSISEQRLVYTENDVRIEVWFAPMRPGARSLTDPDARISGFGQVIGGFVNSAFRLRDRLSQKAAKQRTVYQIEGVPFLVAVGVHDINCSTDEVVSALYGSEVVVVGSGMTARQGDGFFGADKERPHGRRRAVSGVVVVTGVPLGTDATPDVALFDNPFAARPWPRDLMAAVTRTWGISDRTDSSFRMGWIDPPS
jgi:hypothetical protein